MADPLHIHLLGDFRLLHHGVLLADVDTPKLQSLLGYLLLHRDAPQSRSHLAYLFWPDSTESQARTNLRKQLHHLRHALPDAGRFVRADRQTVQWLPDSAFALDLAEFESALVEAAAAAQAGDPRAREAALERASASYGGDLLPGCYDDWAIEERDRLSQRYTDTLQQLVDLLREQHAYSRAIRYAQRLLRHDPLHESTYRTLMHLYAATGNRAVALRTYHTCVTTLAQELEVEPSAATRAVYEQLLQHHATPTRVPAPRSTAAPVPVPFTSPLIGRDEEWAQLQAAWQDAAGGSPQVVLLKGEAGIGKTRLAEEFLATVRRHGAGACIAQCYPSVGSLPYTPVAAWLRGESLQETLSALDDLWLTEVARLLPEILVDHPGLPTPQPLSEQWQQHRLFQALTRPLAAHGQIALLLDDAHWCDPETLNWLGYLLHKNETRPVQILVVATARASALPEARDLADLISNARHSGQATEIDLQLLDQAEVAALATRLARQEISSEQAHAIYRETEGNPLFVTEMVRAGVLARVPQERAGDALALPAAIQHAITSRLAHLSPSARDATQVAATIGRQFTYPILAHASRRDQDSLVPALDELWQRRIIREQGTDAYDFSHDKIREVVYAGLSPARRRLLHRRVAHALKEVHAHNLDSVAAAAALHYDKSGGVAEAVRLYERAAVAAGGMYANQEAIDHLRRALTLARAARISDADVARLHESLGGFLARAGQHAQACAGYEAAIGLAPPSEKQWRARLWMAVASSRTAQYLDAGAHTAYAAALAEIGPQPEEAAHGWWHSWLDIQLARAGSLYWEGRLEDLTDTHRQIEEVIAQHGTAAQQATFYGTVSMLRTQQERYRPSLETVQTVRKALELARLAGNREQITSNTFGLGFQLLWSGDTEGAQEWLTRALTEAEAIGHVPIQDRCLAYLTIVSRLMGDTERVRRNAERALQIAIGEQSHDYIGTAHANLAWVYLCAGDRPAAVGASRKALDHWRHSNNPFEWLARLPLLALHHASGALPEAVAEARAMLEPSQQRLPDPLGARLACAVEAWDGGDHTQVRHHLKAAITLARDINYA